MNVWRRAGPHLEHQDNLPVMGNWWAIAGNCLQWPMAMAPFIFEDLDASRVGYMAKLGTAVSLLNPCGAQPSSCMLTNRTATAIMWHGT